MPPLIIHLSFLELKCKLQIAVSLSAPNPSRFVGTEVGLSLFTRQSPVIDQNFAYHLTACCPQLPWHHDPGPIIRIVHTLIYTSFFLKPHFFGSSLCVDTSPLVSLCVIVGASCLALIPIVYLSVESWHALARSCKNPRSRRYVMTCISAGLKVRRLGFARQSLKQRFFFTSVVRPLSLCRAWLSLHVDIAKPKAFAPCYVKIRLQ